MRQKIVSLALCITILVTGCGTTQNEQKSDAMETAELLPQEISWEIAYEVPTGSVNVLVDREGYLDDRDKIVCFRGEELGNTFQVVDADTDEVVYTGNISEKVFDEGSKEYVSEGDFTDFTTPGTYYIETDIIGRSYRFRIEDNIYHEIFDKMLTNSLFSYVDMSKMDGYEYSEISLENYQEQTNRKDVYEECMALNAQALALQYYPSCYEHQDEQLDVQQSVVEDIYKEAEWLLLMQEKDGSVHAGMYMPEEADDTEDALIAPVSRDATAAFCGSMAICAKLFENVDKDIAVRYTQASKLAWKYIRQGEEDAAFFQSDAWLLWLTGEKQYLTSATRYLEKHSLSVTGDHLTLYGVLAYVSAEAKTDTTICADLMKKIMEISEDTAETVKKDPYHVYGTDMQMCYDRMLIVSIANYVVPNNEYIRVLENHLHYLFGRNKNGYRYITEEGSIMATTDMPGKTREWDGIVRLMMSSILQASLDE